MEISDRVATVMIRLIGAVLLLIGYFIGVGTGFAISKFVKFAFETRRRAEEDGESN